MRNTRPRVNNNLHKNIQLQLAEFEWSSRIASQFFGFFSMQCCFPCAAIYNYTEKCCTWKILFKWQNYQNTLRCMWEVYFIDIERVDRVWWLTPIIPALWEAEEGRSPEVGSTRLA